MLDKIQPIQVGTIAERAKKEMLKLRKPSEGLGPATSSPYNQPVPPISAKNINLN
jgi:hypothetical protein